MPAGATMGASFVVPKTSPYMVLILAIFLYRAKPSYSLCGFVFLPVLLLLYRLVLSGLLNALMPLLFCLGDSSRSRYPVVSLEWSGVSLTEYSLSMHLYIRPSTYRGS